MRPSLRLAGSVLALAVLTACAASATTPQPTASAPAAQTQTVDGLTIALEPPAAPAVNDPAPFRISLTDAAGQPVDGADVYLELGMQGMPMGTNKPVAQPAGSGVYQAQGAFDMAGDWALVVHATVDSKQHVARFRAQVPEKAP